MLRAELLTPISKAWSTEVSQEVTSLGVQVHGGMGFIEETGAAQLMRDARITTIYEGTTGIQANDLIGRKVLRDQGKALFKLLDEVDETAVALADVFPAMESSLQGASRQLRQVTTFVLSLAGEQEHLASAVAYNYLMGTGTIIAGWLMAKSALIATSLRNEGGFYEAKISTAGFYFEQIMPRAQAHLSGVSAAATLTMDFPVEEF